MKPPNERDLITLANAERVFDRRKILLVLLISLAMSLMAVSSTNVALPSLKFALAASERDLQWVLSGYALVFGVILVPCGRAGDVLGRGRFFVLGTAVFSLASLACGLAPNSSFLIFARVVQGVGSGMLAPQTTGMVTQYFSGQGRAKAFALMGVIIAASVAVGPLMTGTIISMIGSSLGWRVSFLVNAVFGTIAISLAIAWFPFEMERHRKAARKSGKFVATRLDLDPIGAVLLASSILSIMLPFVLRRFATFPLFLVGLALLGFWVHWEARYKAGGRAPMVDLSLFSYRSFSSSTLISGIQMLAGTPIFVILVMYLQQDVGISAFIAGIVGLPNAIISGFAAMLAGQRALNIGRNLVIAALSAIIVAILWCVGLVANYGIRVSVLALALSMAIMGFGQGIMGSVNQTLSLAEMPICHAGTAGGIKQTSERIATAIGQAIFMTIFFEVSSQDGSRGLIVAYLASATLMGVALGFAIYDRRKQGAGIPKSTRT